jgi:AbrB family transcriptional regulator (stage V sporulation protein T)
VKATGIVRRIDDLGRVVIPKEIRRTMRIREGDPLEIYTDKEGGVIFRKYSPMGELSDFAAQVCETLHKIGGFMSAVTDRDTVVAVSGPAKREMVDKRLSEGVEQIMEERQLYRCQQGDIKVPVLDGHEKYHVGVAAPILAEGDVSGCVLLLVPAGDTPVLMGETESKLAQVSAGFLGRQMEV